MVARAPRSKPSTPAAPAGDDSASGAATCAVTGADELDDGALVEQFRAGHRRAFDRIVQRYQKPIFYLALRYLRNDADASDVTQRTFVRVFKAIDRFRAASSFRTWIYRIAINLCLNHIRDHRREQATEIRADAIATAPLGASRMIRGQEARMLRDAIAELPPKQRVVLELRIYDELSFREVGELAECSENAAKVNFHHAVKRLRTILAGRDPTGSHDPPPHSKERAR